MFFKIRKNILQLDESMKVKNLEEKSKRLRRGQQHDKQYYEPNIFNQDYWLGYFFQKTLSDWNDLSHDEVDAKTLDTFNVLRICSNN